MPIEVREVVITATVDASAAASGRPSGPPPADAPAVAQDSLVQACVDQVMRILKQQERR